MIEDFDRCDPLENALRELADAERANLFRRTFVDAKALLRKPHAVDGAPQVLRRNRWISIAAVLGLAATICGWIFTTGTPEARQPPLPSGTRTASATRGCDGTFFSCMTGPNGTITNGCDSFDFNADGHIDLVDARTYQLDCNGITR